MANIFEDGFVDTSQHVYRDFSVPNTDPFGVSIFANTDSNGVPTSYDYSFNQAYAFNAAISGDLNRASGVISGMDESFTVPVGEDIEFKVGLKINKQNFIIEDAVFYTGEPSQEGEDLSSGLYPIFGYKSEDNDEGKVYTGIYQVCTVRDGSVITRTLRDNIYLDNIQIKQLGTTGAPTNGVGGQVHLIQESGQYDSSVPILFRGISGGSGIQVTYDSENASGGNFIVIDSTGSVGGGGTTPTVANVGDAADVYVEGSGPTPFNFRSLTGADNDNYSANDLADVYVSVNGNNVEFYSEPWNGENLGGQTPIFKQGDGRFDSKAQFRTLNGATASSDAYFSKIIIAQAGDTVDFSGELTGLWTGENLGSNTDGSVIYVDDSGPSLTAQPSKAQFKRLKGGTNVTISDQTNYLEISAAGGGGGGGIGTVSNLGDGIKIYDESSSAGEADFRTVSGSDNFDEGRLADNEIYVFQDGNVVRFSGQGVDFHNTGDNGEDVYVDGTGPVGANKAAFRKLNSSDSSVSIGGSSPASIDITTDLQSTTDGGQSTTNKVGVGTDGTYVPTNYLEIYGTTKIQNRTTATDGTLQFGNQAASNITYSHTNSAIKFGENVNEIQFINGGTVGIGSSNAVAIGGIDNTTF